MNKINDNIFQYIITNKLDSFTDKTEKWYLKLVGRELSRVTSKCKFLANKFINANEYPALRNSRSRNSIKFSSSLKSKNENDGDKNQLSLENW